MKNRRLLNMYLCILLVLASLNLKAQVDSANTIPPVQTTDSLHRIEFSPEQAQELQTMVNNPVFYLASKVAPVFNIGAYYSYLMPIGTFNTRVSPTSAFTIDIGVNLTRIFGNEESEIHWYLGINGDFTNFGKANNTYSQTVGNTSYHTVLKNSMEVYSYYVEAEYRKSFLCPFASLAYSSVFLDPYKETETKVSSPGNHTSEISGDNVGHHIAHGINAAIGLKSKYRFNNHKELMLLTKVNCLYATATDMIDLNTVTFNSSGETNFTTIRVNPAWFMCSIGIKYNF